jgi:hypothetical protein
MDRGYRISSNGGGKLLIDLLQPRQPVSTLETVEKDIEEGFTSGGGGCASTLTGVAGYTTLDKGIIVECPPRSSYRAHRKDMSRVLSPFAYTEDSQDIGQASDDCESNDPRGGDGERCEGLHHEGR